MHPDDLAMMRAAPNVDDPQPRTCRMRHADGSWRWMEHRITSVKDGQGRHRFFAGVTVDRTEQIEAERDVLTLGQLVQRSPVGQMLVSCTDGAEPVVVAGNQTSADILGTSGTLVGRPVHSLNQGDPSTATLVELIDRITAGHDSHGTLEYHDATGNAYQTTVRAISDHTCSVDFLDITERVEASRLLFEQARRDELTGLPNRRAILEYLEERLAAAPESAFALLVIDLNAFKEINEALGHETGDRLLGQIAERVLDGRPPGHGFAGRQGGDEFAVVLSGSAAEQARTVADGLVSRISEPVMVEGLRLRVGASIGIAHYPADADSVAELIRRADIALYRAKQRGLHVDVYEPESDPFSRGRLGLVGDLETAIAEGELRLFHQPVVDVASGRIVGSETLCRWTHPTLGPIAPDVFIELAESSNQIRDLTRWVLGRAIDDLAQMSRVDPDFTVSVNLSVRNLYEADLVPEIQQMLAEAGVEPRHLVLEITEGSFMDDQAVGVEVLESLRDLGVGTWIDDFGTGHSSFARLRSLPLDGVKIDRSFVSGPASDPDGVVLGSMIELVHALGLRVVAEGVETPAQFESLVRFGADNAQGYFLGRPGPVADLQTRIDPGRAVGTPAPQSSGDGVLAAQ